jgi:predicted O-linked N-acetylglucosamine transferase (SPINDLY family)
MDDDALAERVRADGIDILIDLSLHMAYTRLMLFVKKPAPVQATYLSYPGTSGLPQMDYRITDRFLEPEDRTDGWLGPEKLARLDPCYWCYRMPPEAPDVVDIPSEQAGHITFACTNNFMKVTPRALELWSEILKQVPNSKLRCYLRGGPENSQDVIEAFSEAAIDPKRVELRDQLPYAQYLAAYNEIDIALDPFPYNGGTTTFDALYMGVPVVTLAGELPMGRFGVTIMENLSLQDLIATSPNDYITRAVQLAQNIQRRIDLRKSLRPKLQSSHLTNATQFTRQLENLYQWKWQQWCAKPHP